MSQQDQEDCPICMENTSNHTINCGHKFCKNCIVKWSKSGDNCPLCKKDLVFSKNESFFVVVNSIALITSLTKPLFYNSIVGYECNKKCENGYGYQNSATIIIFKDNAVFCHNDINCVKIMLDLYKDSVITQVVLFTSKGWQVIYPSGSLNELSRELVEHDYPKLLNNLSKD